MAAIPILRFFLPYIIGLGLAIELNFTIASVQILLLCALALFFTQILAFRIKGLKFRSTLNSFLSIILPLSFLTVGFYQGVAHNNKHRSDYKESQLGRFAINELDTVYGHVKASAEVLWLQEDRRVIGELVLIDQLENFKSIYKDTEIIALVELKEFEPSYDPFEFNTKQFYNSRGIYLKTKVVKLINSEKRTGGIDEDKLDLKYRQRLLDVFTDLFPKHSGFMSALILGDRSKLDPIVKEEFIRTGSMHVLAVSGLHVGSIYLILSTLFSSLFNNRKWMFLFIIPFIWTYAVLAGFGEPVQRASIMLSIITIGQVLNREGNSLNTLFITAFVLMTIDPEIYQSVSFRFSFMAVLSIMLFYKRLSRFYMPRFYLDKAIWQLTCLGLSAQILVTPLSIYYFHQFSLAFPLSGIAVVPYVITVFYMGLSTLAFSVVSDQLAKILASYCEMVLDFTLWVNQQISMIPNALVNGISFELRDVLIYYVIVVLVYHYIHFGKKLSLFILLTILCVRVLNYSNDRQKKFVALSGKYPTFVMQDRNTSYIIKKYFNIDEQLSKKEKRVLDQLGIDKNRSVIIPYDLLYLNLTFENLVFFGNGSFACGTSLFHTNQITHNALEGFGIFSDENSLKYEPCNAGYIEYDLSELGESVVFDTKCHSIVIRM